MYRHQLRDCSLLQQGRKSSQFPDNTLFIHECTEQADNTALSLLLYDVSISLLCPANLTEIWFPFRLACHHVKARRNSNTDRDRVVSFAVVLANPDTVGFCIFKKYFCRRWGCRRAFTTLVPPGRQQQISARSGLKPTAVRNELQMQVSLFPNEGLCRFSVWGGGGGARSPAYIKDCSS